MIVLFSQLLRPVSDEAQERKLTGLRTWPRFRFTYDAYVPQANKENLWESNQRDLPLFSIVECATLFCFAMEVGGGGRTIAKPLPLITFQGDRTASCKTTAMPTRENKGPLWTQDLKPRLCLYNTQVLPNNILKYKKAEVCLGFLELELKLINAVSLIIFFPWSGFWFYWWSESWVS